MGFTKKTPENEACVKFIEVISPKNRTKRTKVVDLTSPTEDETIDKSQEIIFVKDKNDMIEKETEKKDEQLHDEEEHGNNVEDAIKDGTRAENNRSR